MDDGSGGCCGCGSNAAGSNGTGCTGSSGGVPDGVSSSTIVPVVVVAVALMVRVALDQVVVYSTGTPRRAQRLPPLKQILPPSMAR